MIKFNRVYLLQVETISGGIISIKRPFTIEFDIHRNTLSAANVGSFRIYNLAPDTRSQIRHDQFNFGDIRTVTFFAGYGSNLVMAFTGFISQAWSVREGNNYITQIESYDGGLAFQTAQTNQSFQSQETTSTITKKLIASLPGVTPGVISPQFNDPIGKGVSYTGATIPILNELTGQSFFIDNAKGNFVNDDEYIDFGEIPLINVQSGLIGTPVRENTYINIDLLFEPSIHAASLVTLESQAADGGFNGTHKVISLKHKGTISSAVCGDAVTSLGLLPGVFNPLDVTSGF